MTLMQDVDAASVVLDFVVALSGAGLPDVRNPRVRTGKPGSPDRFPGGGTPGKVLPTELAAAPLQLRRKEGTMPSRLNPFGQARATNRRFLPSTHWQASQLPPLIIASIEQACFSASV